MIGDSTAFRKYIDDCEERMKKLRSESHIGADVKGLIDDLNIVLAVAKDACSASSGVSERYLRKKIESQDRAISQQEKKLESFRMTVITSLLPALESIKRTLGPKIQDGDDQAKESLSSLQLAVKKIALGEKFKEEKVNE